jgi:hypothetical protein
MLNRAVILGIASVSLIALNPTGVSAQSLLIGGVMVAIGDSQRTTIARLSERFTLDPLDSMNYTVRDRSPNHAAIGSVSFWHGLVSIASREWYSGRNDERALGMALMGALQTLGLHEQPVPIMASYEAPQDPTGVVQIAKFSSGRRTVSVYYSEQANGSYGVQVSEMISRQRP